MHQQEQQKYYTQYTVKTSHRTDFKDLNLY